MADKKANRMGHGTKPAAIPQRPVVYAWRPPSPSVALRLFAQETNSITIYSPRTGGYKKRKGTL